MPDYATLSYRELLKDPQWIQRRNEIAARDGWKCNKCFNAHLVASLKKAIVRFVDFTSCIADPLGSTGNLVFLLKRQVTARIEDSSTTGIIYYKVLEKGEERSVAIRQVDQAEYNEYYLSQMQLEAYYNTVMSNSILTLKTTQGYTDIDLGLLRSKFTSYGSLENYLKTYTIKEINTQLTKEHSWHFSRGLNIHHKYYQEKSGYKHRPPWEYPEEALETLCQYCHTDHHANERVQQLNENGHVIGYLTACNVCGGSGYRPEYWYHDNGICYGCFGNAYLEFK